MEFSVKNAKNSTHFQGGYAFCLAIVKSEDINIIGRKYIGIILLAFIFNCESVLLICI